MILKNQNQSKMNLIDPSDGFQRESMNKSAMSSYEVELAKAIRKALASGSSAADVAAAYKLHTDTVTRLASMALPEEKSRLERAEAIENEFSREAEVVESEDEKAKKEYLAQAEAAYSGLHGKKASAATPDLSDIVRKAIQPSRQGDISEMGGSNKQLRYRNSIWDSEVLARMAETKDNGERIREENAAIANQQQLRRQSEQRIDWVQFKDALENTEMRKDASVTPLGGNENHKYGSKVQKNGISIFDDVENPFSHMAAKTEGEQVRDQRKAPKEKDRSWVKSAGTTKTSSSNFFDKMINSMLDDKE